MRNAIFAIFFLGLSSSCLKAQELTPQVEAVFKNYCVECHSASSRVEKAKKDIPDMLDVKDLIARKKLVPGDPDASEIWKQVKTDQMPDGVLILDGVSLGKEPVSDESKDVLYNWIASLKPDQQLADRKFITDGEILRYVFDDLSRVSRKRASDLRYFTLTNLYNDPRLSDADLDAARQGLSKMINSLSQRRKVVVPQPVDPARTIFRVNISHLGWDAALWDKFARTNPYAKFYDDIFTKSIIDYMGTDLFLLRADWFVSKVSKPPLYYDFANIPSSVEELERRLLFDGLTANENLAKNPDEILRAGFDQGNSGVSAQNRLIERHPSKNGAYWRSFDFKRTDPAVPETAKRDFFKFPTGPGGNDGFEPSGGEIIFNLPNGLQAYMLVNDKGERIDQGPTEIVFDRNAAQAGRNPAITDGISCIACHSAGMIIKEDELLPHVQSANFGLEIREYVEELHRPADLAKAFDEDKARFSRALSEAGVTLVSRDDEPVIRMVERFEDNKVDLIAAAAELGMPSQTLEKTIERVGLDPLLVGIVGRLRGGGVPRNQFIQDFAALASALSIRQISSLAENQEAREKAKAEEKLIVQQANELRILMKGEIEKLEAEQKRVSQKTDQLKLSIKQELVAIENKEIRTVFGLYTDTIDCTARGGRLEYKKYRYSCFEKVKNLRVYDEISVEISNIKRLVE